MKLSPEDKLILSCIKINPTPVELDQINKLIPLVLDWDYLITTIIDRGIGPLLLKKLPLLTNSSKIPESVKNKLQQSYYKTFSRSAVLYEYFAKVAQAFTEHNISVIALKGIYLSEWLYQDIGLRQFSDIDLLVREKDGLNCIEVLRSIGYKSFDTLEPLFVKQKKEIVHFDAMTLDNVSVEIHIKLHSSSERFFLDPLFLWKNSIPITIYKIPVYVLGCYDLLIHLCIHLDKHFRTGHVQFTSFSDITNFLDKYVTILDWNLLRESCLLYNCEDEVFKYIILVNRYMNVSVPEEIIASYTVLLTDNDEKLFVKYLNGFNGVKFGQRVSFHINNIKKLNTSDKWRYLIEVIFPTKTYLLQTYKIRHSYWYWLWYPYRYWTGLNGLIRMLFQKIKKQ